ncbi:hypothetical protein MICPUN_112705 [Micromonas commoda]|uniref:S1 motif domain-containing protein n=1 Tax=Micromonas commoda (strain RCC299 / NOUM17 / CCMP2709) TaxID=296587 RepID=C1FDX4_MICCC|nr:hypothetical protein MICPUN_112705 [Micromonas commoda]ACO68862.1 hypothetical protein MICPUN_112705 [Micromonas commoda]|eukprot:XP_002507604.1 hypothetical protein MICPUN_112705 [Micromonas commoda]
MPSPGASFVSPGESNLAAHLGKGSLFGHGFQVSLSDDVTSNVCGPLALVNKLISARPLRSQYLPEIGDVVLGRVSEVLAKRWKVDINIPHDAVLHLSAVHLPDGIQRRRNYDDELDMRARYGDRDLISAEVQGCFSDGSVALHTRISAYSRKFNGQHIQVLPTLVKRGKRHFCDFQGENYGCTDIEVIYGCNGLIWVGQSSKEAPGRSSFDADTARVDEAHDRFSYVQRAVRELICRVANSVRVLAALGMVVDPHNIIDVCQHSTFLGLQPKDMMISSFLNHLVRERGLV